jgi:hypothetical protein
MRTGPGVQGGKVMVTKRRGLLALVATGLAALLFPGKSLSTGGASAQGEPLEGSWRVDLQRPPPLGPVTAFFTYTPGGCLLTTSTDALSRPAHGAWVKTADREYDYTWVRPSLDSEGTFIGTIRASNHVRVEDTLDAYSTTGVTTDLDLNGNVTATRQVTAQATRIKVAPMS